MGMRVLKLRGESIYASFKSSVIQQAIGYSKSYMYLHKQLWIKDQLRRSGTGYTIMGSDGVDYAGGTLIDKIPWRIVSEKVPGFETFKDRPVEFIRMWNIKSSARGPYKPKDMLALGLNQLFVGQSPKETYLHPGSKSIDPGNDDGIYHDDCYITPKPRYLESGSVECWAYATMVLYDYGETQETKKTYFYKFPKQNAVGVPLLENVEIVQYVKQESKNINGVATLVDYPARRLKFTPVIGDVYYYDLGKYGYDKQVQGSWYPLHAEGPEDEWLDFGKSQEFVVGGKDALVPWVREPTKEEYEAEFGKLLYEKEVEYEKTLWNIYQNPNDDKSVLIVTDADGNEIPGVTIRHARSYATGNGWMKVFTNGTVLEYIPYTVEGNSDMWSDIPAHYKILPMMYTDTGDLTMPHRKFVDEWDQNCELHVYEKSSLGLFKIVAVIIIVIITYFTAGAAAQAGYAALAAMTVAGAALSIIGILSGNKTMMLLGGIVGAISSIYSTMLSSIQTAATTNTAALAGMSTAEAVSLAPNVVSEMTFGEVLAGFSSSAGMGNLFNVGVKTVSTIMQIGDLFSANRMTDVQEVPLDDEVGLTLEFGFDKEAEAMDPVMQLQKEIDLVIRPEL